MCPKALASSPSGPPGHTPCLSPPSRRPGARPCLHARKPGSSQVATGADCETAVKPEEGARTRRRKLPLSPSSLSLKNSPSSPPPPTAVGESRGRDGASSGGMARGGCKCRSCPRCCRTGRREERGAPGRKEWREAGVGALSPRPRPRPSRIMSPPAPCAVDVKEERDPHTCRIFLVFAHTHTHIHTHCAHTRPRGHRGDTRGHARHSPLKTQTKNPAHPPPFFPPTLLDPPRRKNTHTQGAHPPTHHPHTHALQ